MNIEERLRELLLPVFGLDSIDEIRPEASLVKDLGADSLDFVEIIYLIERDFGVILKANEIIVGGINIDPDNLFSDDKLTEEGAALLNKYFPESPSDRFKAGMTRIGLFESLTVKDFANIIKARMKERDNA